MGTVSPPLIVALVLPPHLVVVDPARFGDDDGEEVDGAFQLFDGGLKPRQDVPRYSGGEARVDDPLILLHRPDPTSFGVQRKDAAGGCPTASNRACYPCVECLAWHRARGAPVPPTRRWGYIFMLELDERAEFQPPYPPMPLGSGLT